jgi:polyisoprenoid-binding protein YceI
MKQRGKKPRPSQPNWFAIEIANYVNFVRCRMQVTTETMYYIADSRASRFTAQVFSGGLLSAFGHSPTIRIRDFLCEAEVDLDHIERSALKVTVRTAALSVQDELSDKDRKEMERTMREEILESSSYPEIVYECSGLAVTKAGEGRYSVDFTGDLTMHGVTRRHTVPARVMVNGDAMRAFGEFALLQSHYKLKLASVAGGALKIKDEMKFSFNVLARRKE